MTAAPLFSEVGIYLDTPCIVAVGDLIVTPGGRVYQVTKARRQERGKHAGLRWHLRVFVLVEKGPRPSVHHLNWYKR